MQHLLRLSLFLAALAAAMGTVTPAADKNWLHRFFEDETSRLERTSLEKIESLPDWTEHRAQYRDQLLEMLGLSPLPPRTDLKATITGKVTHPEFYVEKVHFQSSPGLYVTGNLYVPNVVDGKVPAILYVCGHSSMKEDGVSLGNKTGYQHHGAWFARHGYVCLAIDTIQLGELQGLHHGTYREGMWWWNARGYTPAGVEAWNSMRAIDYLLTRPEVDGSRIGMTGRSGGGAYTWYTAALDERVKVAAPIAGITDLRNQVIDGVVKGHCDCMFVVNTHRWDLTHVAAMIAPRPLLLGNTDKDSIFPLDGVMRVHRAVASLYQRYQASDKLGLLISEGPHNDTQDLQVPVLRWFNRFLKGQDPLVSLPAEKLFAPRQLKVFSQLPADEITTKAHESFVPAANPPVPANAQEWSQQRAQWMAALREKAFRGWPVAPSPARAEQLSRESQGDLQVTTWEFTSQSSVRLPLRIHFARNSTPASVKLIHLVVADDARWNATKIEDELRRGVERGDMAIAVLAPRGVGPTRFEGSSTDFVHIRRRYMLLGMTLDGMRVWDICRAAEVLRQPEIFGSKPMHVRGSRDQSVNALYASLFIERLASVQLLAPPASHKNGPDYLNVLRYLDIPQAVAMAAERHPVLILNVKRADWSWAESTAANLAWPSGRLLIQE